MQDGEDFSPIKSFQNSLPMEAFASRILYITSKKSKLKSAFASKSSAHAKILPSLLFTFSVQIVSTTSLHGGGGDGGGGRGG